MNIIYAYSFAEHVSSPGASEPTIFFTLFANTNWVFLSLIFYYIFYSKYLHGNFIISSSKPQPYGLHVSYAYEALMVMTKDIVLSNVGVKAINTLGPILPMFFIAAFTVIIFNIAPFIAVGGSLSGYTGLFCLALVFFVCINTIGLIKHKIKFFSLFLPHGIPFFLSFFCIPVEVVLYLFRPISQSLRVFCNLLVGHTIVEVLFVFLWSLTNSAWYFSYVCFGLLCIVYTLEMIICLVQFVVFSMLLSIYFSDIIKLH